MREGQALRDGLELGVDRHGVVAVVVDDQHGGLDEVEVVPIPEVGLDDPPPPDQPAVGS